MAKKEHVAYENLEHKHNRVGGYDGGSCLTSHQSVYQASNSCSYRWQGIAQAKAHPEPYTTDRGFGVPAPGDETIRTVSLSYAEKLLGVAGVEIRGEAKIPKDKTYLAVPLHASGFITGWSPWPNAVHHVLPIAVLRDAVSSFVDTDAELSDLILGGLLDEKYNINFQINMVILPTQVPTSRAVGLPTHARGDNHSRYSKRLEVEVKQALKSVYEGIHAEKQECEKPDARAMKGRLEKIPKRYYQEILTYGKKLKQGDCSEAEHTLDALVATLKKG